MERGRKEVGYKWYYLEIYWDMKEMEESELVYGWHDELQLPVTEIIRRKNV